MASEMNRDESNRCIQIAIRAYEAGDTDKAIRFLEKSIKLCPSTRATDLLEEIRTKRSEEPEAEPAREKEPQSAGRSRSPHKEHASHNRSSSGARQRKKHKSAQQDFTESRPGSDSRKDYTDEQHQAVLRVKKCSTFYEVLQIEKENFSETVLKKQYRKLALVLHPDKNLAPGSAEAFKIVGKAFAVLSNAQKKAEYDAGGGSETTSYNPQYARQQGRRRYYRSGNFMFFEDDGVSADDIFNMFFGQGFNNRYEQDDDDRPRQRYHQHRHNQDEQRHSSGMTLLLQLSPLILFLLLSALSSLTYTEPVYSMTYSAKYPNSARTKNLEVGYYLKNDLEKVTVKEMQQIEQNVEEYYLQNLREKCIRERALKENMMWRGQMYGDHKLHQRGRDMETPACDNMSRAYQKLAAAA